MMRALIACERFGRVRDAFRAVGVDAWSCDRLPDASGTDGAKYHIVGDCEWFAENVEPFDMMIAFPPCTFLSVSGAHWNGRRPGRAAETQSALDFVSRLASIPIERKCIENPVGLISTHWRKPDQIIQPYQFGDDASKKTCLWLEGLPLLTPTAFVPPRLVMHEGKMRERWANQTDSGQNKLGPSPERAADRGKTYAGIAAAMADQWGRL